MKQLLRCIGIGACLQLLVQAQENSALWGRSGELWNPAGRLPDVSYAGYACGERPLPNSDVTANVRDFGAKGDGTTDDSAAFQAALAKVKRGAIFVPPGRYRITRILEITRPGIVLRGAGPKQSVLVCPVPLESIKPNMGENTGGRPTSEYSWSGGMVWFKGRNPGKAIGSVAAPAVRGDHELRIQGEISNLHTGEWVEISVVDDANKTLLGQLYSGDPGNVGKIRASTHRARFITRVRSITGSRLILERPLRFDLRPEWKPELRRYQPTVTECGIEDLAFEFPARKYGGHFTELGYNAIAFTGVADCWARNLRITNADSAIFANGDFCTIDGLRCELQGAEELKGVFGHHGVSLTGDDNLFTRFEIAQRFIHDITVSEGAGNVASSGRGTDLSFDHHKRAPYDNVFTDIDLGIGSRMWRSGGGAALGWPCGARGTFWNIRSEKAQSYPEEFGPWSINLVGVQTQSKSDTKLSGKWFEVISPAALQPADLHKAQWQARLGVR